MVHQKVVGIYQLEQQLKDINSAGCFVGLMEESTWKLLVYLGNRTLLVLFEKGKGLLHDSMQYLSQNCDIEKQNFHSKYKADLNLILIDQYQSVRSYAQFYKYNLNIFTTASNNNMKSVDFLHIIKFNLLEIDNLEEGDVILFDRGFYHHSAVLTDKLHMLCIHRSCDGDSTIVSASSLGKPSAKASITEDHLIEIAGHSKIKKSNEIFDKRLTPRYYFFNYSKNYFNFDLWLMSALKPGLIILKLSNSISNWNFCPYYQILKE